ncbi:MAG TPA: carboxypeptidase-like regulatory domain-containing protein [Bryobacteraceae bacterium]|nr:carboxypeptidase-like regulatory domain-containing protein [Bryobacteraceae bacterium]
MRALWIFLLLTISMCAQNTPPVEGVVLTPAGVGIAGVTVELTAQGKKDAAYTVATDKNGRFQIAAVAPGDYSVSYDLEGYGPPDDEPTQTPLHVSPDASVVTLRHELLPMATLSGQVLDTDGNPVPKVAVEWLNTIYGLTQMTTTTDDQGRFRFPRIMPGSYIVRAAPDSNIDRYIKVISKPRQERSAPDYQLGADRKLWAPTYFPNSLDRAQASVIRVRGGESLEGFDIHLQKTTAFRIHGVVLDESGRGAAHASVKLKSADTQDMTSGRPPYAEVNSGEDGSFEFPSVGPGRWRIVAEIKEANVERRGFATPFVTRFDLEDIRIHLSAPFPVTGIAEGLTGKETRPAQFRLVPVDGPVEQDVYSGSLKEGKMYAEAYPGRYQVSVGTPVGYYLDSILFEHRDVLGQEIELSTAPPTLRFVYRADGGHAHGSVENGSRASVILIPQNETWFAQRLFLYQARCDDAGHYKIDHIRPGDYFAIALSQMDWSLLYSPSAMTVLAKIATRITVEHDADTVADLKAQVWPE